MSQQVDLTPATAPGIHAHVPNGQSASVFNNPTDNPSVKASVATPAGKAVTATISATDKVKVRFANPS